jgi:hypothetical protein
LEINHLCLILPSEEPKEEIIEQNLVNHFVKEETKEASESPIPPLEELSEFIMKTEDLAEAEVHLDNLNIYKVYEFLNTKIKETLIEEIRTLFISKKIKTKLNFSEVVDDEEPDE